MWQAQAAFSEDSNKWWIIQKSVPAIKLGEMLDYFSSITRMFQRLSREVKTTWCWRRTEAGLSMVSKKPGNPAEKPKDKITGKIRILWNRLHIIVPQCAERAKQSWTRLLIYEKSELLDRLRTVHMPLFTPRKNCQTKFSSLLVEQSQSVWSSANCVHISCPSSDRFHSTVTNECNHSGPKIEGIYCQLVIWKSNECFRLRVSIICRRMLSICSPSFHWHLFLVAFQDKINRSFHHLGKRSTLGCNFLICGRLFVGNKFYRLSWPPMEYSTTGKNWFPLSNLAVFEAIPDHKILWSIVEGENRTKEFFLNRDST